MVVFLSFLPSFLVVNTTKWRLALWKTGRYHGVGASVGVGGFGNKICPGFLFVLVEGHNVVCDSLVFLVGRDEHWVRGIVYSARRLLALFCVLGFVGWEVGKRSRSVVVGYMQLACVCLDST